MPVADRPLRVLMLSHYFAHRRGGIEAVAAALGRELTLLGFQVRWLATGGVIDGAGLEYQCDSLAAGSSAEKLLAIPYPLLRPSAWRRIYREAARHDVILVHDAVYMTSLAGYFAARAHRKPLVVVQHVGFVPFQSALLRTLMRVANRCIAMPLLRGADRVIFISELTRSYFADVPWRRAPLLIFNGVDTDIFSPLPDSVRQESERRALELPAVGPVILFVGRFVEKKGLLALEYVARQRSDALFAFAGSGPIDPGRWGLPNVRVYSGLTGARLAALYRASDVLVLPSVGEGFPLVIQEALACGLAVICGSDTVCADRRAQALLRGVAVDLHNPAATAGRLLAELNPLLARSCLQAERRERAEFARANYSWAATGASYAQTLRGLCAHDKL